MERIYKEKNFISIVVYIRNNEKNIEKFLQTMDKYFYDKFQSYESILVNDFSKDSSIKKIKLLSLKLKGNITLINLPWYHGLEKAMLAGIDISIGDFVIEFDSTVIDYDLFILDEIYKKCLSGYDVVSASKDNGEKTFSKIFYFLLKKLSLNKIELSSETFRIISRRALNRIMKTKERIRYRKAIYHYSGFDTFVYKYKTTNNKIIQSSLPLIERIDLALDILINYSSIATQIATILSMFFALFTIFTMGYTVYSYLTIRNIQNGWTTMMLFLSFSLTGVFFILGIITKYLNYILNEVQNKPRYIFKSVERLSKK